MDKIYRCICGEEFTDPQVFNGHKAHCKIHLKNTGRLETREKLQKEFARIGSEASARKAIEKKNNALKVWISEKHVCENCGELMTEKYGSGRFCCRACANSRKCSDETKAKIGAGVRNAEQRREYKTGEEEYKLNPNYCSICGKELPYIDRHRCTCSDECLATRYRQLGQSSYFSKNSRSKNEIEFCNLCEEYFTEVYHNENIFNGWDADVIIEDIKYAILWNGIWHYQKVTPNHKLAQVQNRDKIKISEIEKCGYVPYVIKDMGQYNPEFVKNEFEKFITYLRTK